MNEISEAAKREACRLAEKESGYSRTWNEALCVDGSGAYVALARVLQEHSDVAKEARALLDGIAEDTLRPEASLLEHRRQGEAAVMVLKLHPLILPDEPVDLLRQALNKASQMTTANAGGPIYYHITEDDLAGALDAAGYEIRRKDAP